MSRLHRLLLGVAPALLIGSWLAPVDASLRTMTPPPGAGHASEGACGPGFAAREAGPGDDVCVGFHSRDRVRIENRLAADRAQGSGCRAGFVPRAAFAGDATCVTPSAHAWVQLENGAAARRSVLPGATGLATR